MIRYNVIPQTQLIFIDGKPSLLTWYAGVAVMRMKWELGASMSEIFSLLRIKHFYSY